MKDERGATVRQRGRERGKRETKTESETHGMGQPEMIAGSDYNVTERNSRGEGREEEEKDKEILTQGNDEKLNSSVLPLYLSLFCYRFPMIIVDLDHACMYKKINGVCERDSSPERKYWNKRGEKGRVASDRWAFHWCVSSLRYFLFSLPFWFFLSLSFSLTRFPVLFIFFPYSIFSLSLSCLSQAFSVSVCLSFSSTSSVSALSF